MNNIENVSAEGLDAVSVEAFRSMSPNARREVVREGLNAKPEFQFGPADIDAVVTLTARLLNSEKPDTVKNAFDLAAEIRLEAVKDIGQSSPRVYATDVEGSVVAAGSNSVEAMKKAQEEKAA